MAHPLQCCCTGWVTRNFLVIIAPLYGQPNEKGFPGTGSTGCGRSRRALASSGGDQPPLASNVAAIGINQRHSPSLMSSYDVPGMSFAIAVRGQMVYEQAFGVADRSKKGQLEPSQLFRIASVTKPITSVAIFLLWWKRDREDERTSDFVFGPQGIFQHEFGPTAKRPNLQDMRVEHVLTHTGGGWQNDNTDPMFRLLGQSLRR